MVFQQPIHTDDNFKTTEFYENKVDGPHSCGMSGGYAAFSHMASLLIAVALYNAWTVMVKLALVAVALAYHPRIAADVPQNLHDESDAQ
ncbi:hypothetical protein Tco_0370779 [Tanacetum coccineum]